MGSIQHPHDLPTTVDDDELQRRAQEIPVTYDVPAGMKQCTKCGDIVKLEGFSRRTGHSDRRLSWCKVCRADHDRMLKEANLALKARHAERERERQRRKRGSVQRYTSRYQQPAECC